MLSIDRELVGGLELSDEGGGAGGITGEGGDGGGEGENAIGGYAACRRERKREEHVMNNRLPA